MNTTTFRPTPSTLRLQEHLDRADRDWFARNPGARHRIRLFVPGENVEPGELDKYIVITRTASGEFRRRFLGEAARP